MGMANMMTTLSQLLTALPGPYMLHGNPDTPIAAPVVEADADLEPGGVFVARRGASFDGHSLIGQAVERGAAAIVGERPLAEIGTLAVPYVQVERAALAVGWLAAAYHGHPSRRLHVIGVTGTDGKTTTSTILHAILQAASGGRAGLISTVNALVGDQTYDTGLHVTTPGAPLVQSLLARMAAAGLVYAVLEMTSHGLAQGRLEGVAIDTAVLTNLTHEHLDYHGTFDAYREAKGRMFAMLADSARKSHIAKVSIINGDDANAAYFAAFPADRLLMYGLETSASVRGSDIVHRPGYTQFMVRGEGLDGLFHLPLAGDFNVKNALAAITAARAIGILKDVIARGLLAVPPIPGRLERIDASQPYLALVDFAHTPNALGSALQAARGLVAEGGRVIVVFGCAGLRDREKRKLMPQAAITQADFAVFTAEDPRTEPLESILDTMCAAAIDAGGREGRDFARVPDRGAALAFACAQARPGDVVLACGKGHERSMAFGTVEYPWDDREALRAAIAGAPLATLPTAGL